MRYVRFVIGNENDPDTHHPLGVFQAAYNLLRENADLSPEQRAHMRTTLDWFNENLDKPDRLARSRKAQAAPKAISWMKLDAGDHIDQLHELCEVVSAYHTVHEVRTDRPGYITHEDSHQVIAEPFADTFQRGQWKQYTNPRS